MQHVRAPPFVVEHAQEVVRWVMCLICKKWRNCQRCGVVLCYQCRKLCHFYMPCGVLGMFVHPIWVVEYRLAAKGTTSSISVLFTPISCLLNGSVALTFLCTRCFSALAHSCEASARTFCAPPFSLEPGVFASRPPPPPPPMRVSSHPLHFIQCSHYDLTPCTLGGLFCGIRICIACVQNEQVHKPCMPLQRILVMVWMPQSQARVAAEAAECRRLKRLCYRSTTAASKSANWIAWVTRRRDVQRTLQIGTYVFFLLYTKHR